MIPGRYRNSDPAKGPEFLRVAILLGVSIGYDWLRSVRTCIGTTVGPHTLLGDDEPRGAAGDAGEPPAVADAARAGWLGTGEDSGCLRQNQSVWERHCILLLCNPNRLKRLTSALAALPHSRCPRFCVRMAVRQCIGPPHPIIRAFLTTPVLKRLLAQKGAARKLRSG